MGPRPPPMAPRLEAPPAEWKLAHEREEMSLVRCPWFPRPSEHALCLSSSRLDVEVDRPLKDLRKLLLGSSRIYLLWSWRQALCGFTQGRGGAAQLASLVSASLWQAADVGAEVSRGLQLLQSRSHKTH